MAGMTVRTSYDPEGTATVTLPREGVDIGPRPDFWADFEAMQRRLKPRPSPGAYAQARGLGAPASIPAMEERRVAPTQPFASRYTQTFGVPYMEPRAGQLYQPWSPGQVFNPMYPPVFTGWWR